METKYALLACTTRLQVPVATVELESKSTLQNFTVTGGTLIKLAQQCPAKSELTENTVVQIFVYDTVRREPNTTQAYQCSLDNLLPVHDNLWPFLLSIPEPQRRLQLLLDEDRCSWICATMPGDEVSIPGRCLQDNGNMRYDCVICYIGPVPEIHPVGYFFGLEILNTTPSPQATDIPFTRKYFECNAEDAIFTTADRIVPTPPKPEDPVTTREEVEEEESPTNASSIHNLAKLFIRNVRSVFPF